VRTVRESGGALRRRLTARNIDVVECSRLAPAAGSPQAGWQLPAQLF